MSLNQSIVDHVKHHLPKPAEGLQAVVEQFAIRVQELCKARHGFAKQRKELR